MRCLNCGHYNPPHFAFCSNCGNQIGVFCTSCGYAMGPDDQFCTQCGRIATHTSASQEVPRNPFRKIRSRTLILWALASSPIAVVIFLLADLLPGVNIEDPTADLIATDLWLYGTLAAWMLWQFSRHRVDLRRLIGRLPRGYNWFPALGVLLATFLFSIGSLIVVSYLASLVAPDLIESLLSEDPLDPISEPSSPAAFLVVSAVSLVVLAPVVEELFYRGVLLHRWSLKWGLGTAIFASSLFFGIVHLLDVVGATMFGIVAAILYIKTRSLLVPMALHLINNAFVVVASLVFQAGQTEQSVGAIEELQSKVVAGLVLLVITTPVLVWYIRRNWPRPEEVMPYEDQANEDTSHIASS